MRSGFSAFWLRTLKLAMRVQCYSSGDHVSDGRAVTAVDKRLGERVRARRLAIGMSQEELAAALGVTFQQVQKYEKGANRIAASRLVDIAAALDLPIADFFDGLQKPKQRTGAAPAGFDAALATPGALDLVKQFAAMRSPRLRRRVLELVEAMQDDD